MAVSEPPPREALPPHNIEAETSVLGAVLLADQALDGIQIDVGLVPEDFYRDSHAQVFRAMNSLKARSEPVDALTVCEELGRSERLEAAGGEAYVHSLPTLVPAAGNARHYARIVRDHALMRRLLGAAREIEGEALAFAGDARDIAERAERSLFQVAHREHSGDLHKIDDLLLQQIDRLEKISKEGLDIRGTPSGFRDLDNLTGGFQPGNLIVVAARPSMGKSALIANIAENAAVDYDKPVVLFSLEMSEAELAERFIASRDGKISSDELRKGNVAERQWPRIIQATEKLSRAPLYIDDSSDLGIHELRAKARRQHGRTPLGLVIVDYLQLMRAEDPSNSRVEQIGQISRGLKILARELEVPVIAVSQLSRAVEQRPDKRPILSDLRESGQIEQDADLVIFVYRHEYYDPEDEERQGEGDLIIAKHRNGPVDKVTLAFRSRQPMFLSKAARRFDDGGATASNGAGL